MDDSEGTARWADDAALVDRLGRVLAAVDPAPPSVEQNARRLLSWRSVDVELAEVLCAGRAAPPPATG
jgi:hypothetical protein